MDSISDKSLSDNNSSSTSSEKFKKNKLTETNLQCELFSFNGNSYQCKVVKCYDGDTIHCVFKFNKKYQRFIIRLAGCDTPEIRTRDPLEKEKGYMARDRLKELIYNKIVTLECGKFDKYGRILGTIKLNKNDEKSVNDIMIDEGHAVKYVI